ncbi:Sugar phosphate isomerase/epimerase [Sporobacter termitidis DSM 10068]|uniref:Sugar phosphate isomerase/epimerase n=1 Tax=Sporobacter termitidis DSM 10068 TaxID=1123282 RepID=A0A1M5YRD6_9FIRM|nr:sugar phosphate isomerase/epimerase family protein [Sporobacter termitidis]SHI14602.1 Sugar phosphate isomerase/epimerase [Sporobacter termitidis DSM 10068]
MKFGCCTTIENYDLLVKRGYDRIILPAAGIMEMNAQAFDRLRETLDTGPVKCRALNSFCQPRLVLCGPLYNAQAVAAYSRALAGRAGSIGVRYIGVGAPESRSIPPDYPYDTAMLQFGQSLAVLCRACAPYGITVLLEAVCELECNFITTTDEAVNVVEGLHLENLQLVFDTYHAQMMAEDGAPLRRAVKYVRLVHVAQDSSGSRRYLRRDKMDEYRVYFNVLHENGYDGEVSIEALNDDIETQLLETLEIMKDLCLPTKK